MEKLGEVAKKVQAGLTLHKSSKNDLVKKEASEYTLTAYSGELTQASVAKNVAKVKAAFPALTPEFFKILVDRLVEKGFSDERLTDSVNNLIDTCQYPTPTLANILSFDKRVKILDYNQVCSLIHKQEAAFDNFSKIFIGEKMFYVRTSDKEIYNIPDRL